jgi:hypothetical protein
MMFQGLLLIEPIFAREITPNTGLVCKTNPKVTPKKFANIVEYLQSPASNTEGMAAAFTLFLLLHDLKLDVLGQLDLKDPGHEGWVMATPAGYSKAVNRFDFTARNAARNNPQPG